jgi:hypothetical protein
MMSLNYSAEEFLKIMMTLNFKKFEDGCDLEARGAAVSIKPGVERSGTPGASSQKFEESAKRPIAVRLQRRS